MNRTRKMISGITGGEINLSEGYLVEHQKRYGEVLTEFDSSLSTELLKQELLYWDDTVVMVNQKRGCLRFYGTEKLALYKAHLQKNKKEVLSDGILTLLNDSTKAVHDHNIINHGEDFIFSNIECNAHLLLDLESCYENTHHSWAKELKHTIQTTYKEREELLEQEKDGFEDSAVYRFFSKLSKILVSGIEEYQSDDTHYYSSKERALLDRLLKYQPQYFAWVVDFGIPFTNNLSERSLRGVKSKIKISGQLQNITSARSYARIRSYSETAYRNGINPMTAFLRLTQGKALTLEEIIKSTQ